MYNVTLFKIDKKINSTATPTGGVAVGVTLKGGCSILTPVFYLELSSFDFNMVKFNDRYYWIRDVKWLRQNYVEISCSVDVLASFKHDILNSSGYVLYSQSNYNQHITDSRLLMEERGNVKTWTGDRLAFFDSDGSYTVGVIGKPNAPSPTGMTCVYSLSTSQASELAVAFNEGDVMQQITQQFGSAFNALIFSRWIPLRPDETGRPASISIAAYNTGISAKMINSRYEFQTFQFVIPWETDDFRRAEPFCTGYLFLPYVGIVPLALSNLYEMTTVNVKACVDRYTGDIVYKIGGDNSPLAIYTGNCGIEVPINSYQRDWKGVVQTGISTMLQLAGSAVNAGVTAAMGGGGEQEALSGGMQALGGVANAGMSYMTFNTGTVGGFSGGAGSALGQSPQVTLIYHNSSQSPSALAPICGRPCGKTLKLSSLSGYVQVSCYSPHGEMTETEKIMIKQFVETGVYLE